MKVLGATLLVLLCTMALCSPERDETYVASTCCFSYVSRIIPRRLVVAYFKTGSQCSTDGVVFLTRKGYHICADPSEAWVQEYIKDMEESTQVEQ